jgi:hypothetical protein
MTTTATAFIGKPFEEHMELVEPEVLWRFEVH